MIDDNTGFLSGFLIGAVVGMVFMLYFVVKPDMMTYAENNVTAKQIVCQQFHECEEK